MFLNLLPTPESAGNVLYKTGALSIGFYLFMTTSLILQAQEEDPYEEQRRNLIENVLKPGGIKSKAVLDAIEKTPRHDFLPEDLLDQAYLDIALPIGEAQTISSPYIVAVMTEVLQPKSTDKVLEIGTGSGYQAAVLSPLVKSVFTIEIVEDLGKSTIKLLQTLGYKNIYPKIGDGFQGWKENAPFDKIIVTCSPDKVPAPLTEQLKEGGLMVIPVGPRYQQLLHVFRKKDGKLVSEYTRPTLFVPMTGTAESQRVDKPDPTNPKIYNGDFEAKAIGKFIPYWYYEFGAKLVTDPKALEGKQVVEFTSSKPGVASILLQAFPIDGRSVSEIRLSGATMISKVKQGETIDNQPKISIQFLDENRNQVALNWLGPYVGNRGWKKESRKFAVPHSSREAIIRIGLHGATGTVRFDDIAIEAIGVKKPLKTN